MWRNKTVTSNAFLQLNYLFIFNLSHQYDIVMKCSYNCAHKTATLYKPHKLNSLHTVLLVEYTMLLSEVRFRKRANRLGVKFSKPSLILPFISIIYSSPFWKKSPHIFHNRDK